jgi:hypothetical protein
MMGLPAGMIPSLVGKTLSRRPCYNTFFQDKPLFMTLLPITAGGLACEK